MLIAGCCVREKYAPKNEDTDSKVEHLLEDKSITNDSKKL